MNTLNIEQLKKELNQLDSEITAKTEIIKGYQQAANLKLTNNKESIVIAADMLNTFANKIQQLRAQLKDNDKAPEQTELQKRLLKKEIDLLKANIKTRVDRVIAIEQEGLNKHGRLTDKHNELKTKLANKIKECTQHLQGTAKSQALKEDHAQLLAEKNRAEKLLAGIQQQVTKTDQEYLVAIQKMTQAMTDLQAADEKIPNIIKMAVEQKDLMKKRDELREQISNITGQIAQVNIPNVEKKEELQIQIEVATDLLDKTQTNHYKALVGTEKTLSELLSAANTNCQTDIDLLDAQIKKIKELFYGIFNREINEKLVIVTDLKIELMKLTKGTIEQSVQKELSSLNQLVKKREDKYDVQQNIINTANRIILLLEDKIVAAKKPQDESIKVKKEEEMRLKKAEEESRRQSLIQNIKTAQDAFNKLVDQFNTHHRSFDNNSAKKEELNDLLTELVHPMSQLEKIDSDTVIDSVDTEVLAAHLKMIEEKTSMAEQQVKVALTFNKVNTKSYSIEKLEQLLCTSQDQLEIDATLRAAIHKENFSSLADIVGRSQIIDYKPEAVKSLKQLAKAENNIEVLEKLSFLEIIKERHLLKELQYDVNNSESRQIRKAIIALNALLPEKVNLHNRNNRALIAFLNEMDKITVEASDAEKKQLVEEIIAKIENVQHQESLEKLIQKLAEKGTPLAVETLKTCLVRPEALDLATHLLDRKNDAVVIKEVLELDQPALALMNSALQNEPDLVDPLLFDCLKNQPESAISKLMRDEEHAKGNHIFIKLLLKNKVMSVEDKMKSAEVYQKIADFTYAYPNEIKKEASESEMKTVELSLKIFRQDARKILTIGNLNNLETRKALLNKSAHQRFVHRDLGWRVLADVLQCITGAFPIVMGVRYLLGKSAFFSQKKSTREMRVEEIVKEEKENKSPTSPKI